MRTSIKVPIPYVYVKSGEGLQGEENSGDVSLYSTRTSVVAIDSPVKRMILNMIPPDGISFDEIVTRTGKAKSTISVHLRDLESLGLISSQPDPRDQRKKILSVISEPIGWLTNTDRRPAGEQIHRHSESLPFTEGDIASFFRYTLRVFRTEAMNLGMNLDPILERAGMRIGLILAPLVADNTLTGKVSKMNQFWQTYGLGYITLISEKPITLRVEGCFECQDLPVTGHGSCAFDIGVLSSLFAEEFENAPQVCEVECYSSGFDHCTFTISGREQDQH